MPQQTTFNKPSTKERNGYTDFQTMGYDLACDMIDRGFELVSPDKEFGINPTTLKLTLRPRTPTDDNSFTPDPLAVTPGNTWHIAMDFSGVTSATDPGFMRFYVATPLQLTDNGDIAEDGFNNAAGVKDYIRKAGELTSGWYNTSTFPGPSGLAITKNGDVSIPFASGFWGAKTPVAEPTSESGSRTYSYRLTVSYQGLAVVIWEEGKDDTGKHFSWFVVQRPVDPANSGSVLKTGKAPVFCMYSIGGGAPNNPIFPDNLENAIDPYLRIHKEYDDNPDIYRFTVRESDVLRPTIPVLATVDSPDNRQVINAKQQVAITEGNKYVVSFPSGFNTDRYMYREEIDLITYTSADVISQYSNVAVSVYGEDDNRQYKAMQANLPDNTGMRILILTYGPGFDQPT